MQVAFSGLAYSETCLAGQVGRCSGTDALAAKSQIKPPWVRCCQLAPILAGSLGKDLFPLGQEMRALAAAAPGQNGNTGGLSLQRLRPHLTSFLLPPPFHWTDLESPGVKGCQWTFLVQWVMELRYNGIDSPCHSCPSDRPELTPGECHLTLRGHGKACKR